MKCLGEDQWIAWLEGGIPPDEAEAIEAHIEGCATCTKERAALEALAADLRSLPEVDERAHVDAVLARLDRAPPKEQAPSRRRQVVVAVAAIVALAAAILLVARF